MYKRLPDTFSWLSTALIFFTFSNLFLVLDESWGYVNGLRVDYLLPKIFLTDLLLLPVIAIGLWLQGDSVIRWMNRAKILLLVALLVALTQVFATYPQTSFFTVIKGIELGLLFIVLVANRTLLKRQHLTWALSLSIVLQAVLGWYQFMFQHSAAPYWLLGESSLNSSALGLARTSFGGEERLLAYGSTAHPNILAGVSVLFFLLVVLLDNKRKNIWLVLPVISTLFITQSISALAALLIGLLFNFKKTVFSSASLLKTLLFLTIVTPFFWRTAESLFDNPSITRRAELHHAAVSMVVNKPLLGVGLNNFTVVLEEYLSKQEFVRFIQPAHNSLWLLSAETGVLGLLLLWLIVKNMTRHLRFTPVILALVPLLSIDHYMTTTQTGLLALVLFTALSSEKTSRHHQELE